MSKKYQSRIGELLRGALVTLIERQLNDPRVEGITVTDVEVTADTHYATVFWSMIGDVKARERAQQGLTSASGWLSREIGLRLKTKNTPKLIFKYDPSLERGDHMQRLIDQIVEREKTEPKNETVTPAPEPKPAVVEPDESSR